MIDMKLLRENPEAVKENIRKKFQDEKLKLVDEVILIRKAVKLSRKQMISEQNVTKFPKKSAV